MSTYIQADTIAFLDNDLYRRVVYAYMYSLARDVFNLGSQASRMSRFVGELPSASSAVSIGSIKTPIREQYIVRGGFYLKGYRL
jgi:hypothetical protein